MFSNNLCRTLKCIPSSWNQVKRSAGHSKWQNIRHGKAIKDADRAAHIIRSLRNIRCVIADNGWVTDPAQSPPLARALEAAQRANVPKETIDNFFKKFQAVREHPIHWRFRGPKDSIFLATFLCARIAESDLRYNVKKILQKTSVLEVTTGFQQAFETKGIVLAKHSEKEASLDDAEEAAILAGAEEVRIEDDDHVYRYLTEAGDLGKVAKDLRNLKWDVLDASLEQLPTYLVEIPESELSELQEVLEKLQELPEFCKMVDNVA